MASDTLCPRETKQEYYPEGEPGAPAPGYSFKKLQNLKSVDMLTINRIQPQFLILSAYSISYLNNP